MKQMKMMLMENKAAKFEIISHERAIKNQQENKRNLARLRQIKLPKKTMGEALNYMNKHPLTNKYWRKYHNFKKAGD